MLTPVRFHFDFLSPFAYLAWCRVHDVALRHGREVEPVPVLLAGILAAHGTRGPAEIPAKRAWVYKDAITPYARPLGRGRGGVRFANTTPLRAGSARGLGVAFGPPPTHPFNPLLALRVAGEPMDLAIRRALIDALYAAVWAGDGPGVEDPAVVVAICDRVGLDGAAVVASAGGVEAKARLKADTERAIADGVFGVPTMIVDGEQFWGADRLDHLDRFLGGETISADETARWTSLRATATRRQP